MKLKFVVHKHRIIISGRTLGIVMCLIVLFSFGLRYFLTMDRLTLKNPQGAVTKLNLDSNSVKTGELEKVTQEYEDKFVLVFFYDGYSSQKEALAQIDVLKQTLRIIEPFKSASKMTVLKVFTTDSQKCTVKEAAGQRLLVCDKKLIESFRKLGIDHFKLVILSPLDFVSTALPSRGSNSWMSLSTNAGGLSQGKYNRLLALQFAQNLGRGLGLAHESVSKSNTTATPLFDSPNCARDVTTAQKLWGNYTSVFSEVGYNKGCNYSLEFIYPEKDTLMSQDPKKESYGKVSEDYLRQVLYCFYGNKETVDSRLIATATYSATLSSCNLFKQMYPDFWKE